MFMRNTHGTALRRISARCRYDRSGLIARTHRAFDGGWQAGLDPVAGEQDIRPSRARIRPFGVLRRGRGEGRALFLDDLPGRHIGRETGRRRRLPPDLGRERVARSVDEAVSVANGDREPIWESEQPFDLSVHDADDRRLAARRLDMEMDIENGTKFVRRREARKEFLRDPWRRADDHKIVRAEFLLRPIKVERNGAFRLELGSPGGGRRIEQESLRASRKASAGSMKLRPSPWAANSGWQAFPPRRESRAAEPP